MNKIKKVSLVEILEFIKTAEGLKRELRHSWLSNGRRESVAEHTWRMALMVIVLVPELSEKINLSHLLEMILTHDLPEIYAGDLWAFKNKNEQQKHDREKTALQKLLKILSASMAQKIMRLWEEYETCETIEAKVANALDKMEVLIQHNQAKLTTWNTIEKTPAYSTEYGDAFCAFNKVLADFKSIIRKETAKKLGIG